MNLKRRIEWMERKLKPGELRAVMEGFVDESGVRGALAIDDPKLQEGVDEEGEAVISRWWSVWFFEGTREQQDARLKELRLDPRFQTPCSEDEFPGRFEGGATCEDVYSRLEERKPNDLRITAGLGQVGDKTPRGNHAVNSPKRKRLLQYLRHGRVSRPFGDFKADVVANYPRYYTQSHLRFFLVPPCRTRVRRRSIQSWKKVESGCQNPQ